ncbi:hypothetical protein COCCU_07105 [Corynebacterium occultum]|uniref:Uncharacterized protein n=1 Tax=Corynebacterium occultum TaxID=2675219 RepID=A0A6B8W7S9_9CORY|nr:hypothetical protein COCCU_07105 [Corynebacterium occultum]
MGICLNPSFFNPETSHVLSMFDRGMSAPPVVGGLNPAGDLTTRLISRAGGTAAQWVGSTCGDARRVGVLPRAPSRGTVDALRHPTVPMTQGDGGSERAAIIFPETGTEKPHLPFSGSSRGWGGGAALQDPWKWGDYFFLATLALSWRAMSIGASAAIWSTSATRASAVRANSCSRVVARL